MNRFAVIFSIVGIIIPGVLSAQVTRPQADGRPVSFVTYREEGDWQTWTDERLSLRIPVDCRVAIDCPASADRKLRDDTREPEPHSEWTYRIISADERQILVSILVVQGGPEFVDCFCAPQNVYEYSEIDGFKIWALTLPDLNARLFKAATKSMRLDIHGDLPADDAERVRYIIENSRPVEPKT